MNDKQRLREDTTARLLELAHALSDRDFRRHRRHHPVPIGTVVYLLEILAGIAPAPTTDDDAARLELLLQLIEERGNAHAPLLRARLRALMLEAPRLEARR